MSLPSLNLGLNVGKKKSGLRFFFGWATNWAQSLKGPRDLARAGPRLGKKPGTLNGSGLGRGSGPSMEKPSPNLTRCHSDWEEDARLLHHPHNDALVVSIYVGDYNVHQVLVDNGSSADILYYTAFQ